MGFSYGRLPRRPLMRRSTLGQIWEELCIMGWSYLEADFGTDGLVTALLVLWERYCVLLCIRECVDR
jgi:hypothetical protein